jgi:hypothetical protein
MSEWRALRFTPQPDITAYELATILRRTSVWNGAFHMREVYIRVFDLDKIDRSIMRHFDRKRSAAVAWEEESQ